MNFSRQIEQMKEEEEKMVQKKTGKFSISPECQKSSFDDKQISEDDHNISAFSTIYLQLFDFPILFSDIYTDILKQTNKQKQLQQHLQHQQQEQKQD